jgi:hypothetical protein
METIAALLVRGFYTSVFLEPGKCGERPFGAPGSFACSEFIRAGASTDEPLPS